jgi:hypothetical protein
MQNLDASAVSRGAIVFAFNTEKVDYVAIADQSSRLIQHNLGLPVTIVTDPDSDPKCAYDNIIRLTPDDDGQTNFRGAINNQTIAWRNFGRYLAYELSPYDETVLLDTDYLVLDNTINTLFATDFDYRLMHDNQSTSTNDNDVMGTTSLPFVWATVVLFRKSERSRMLFDLVGRIQRNYRYYRALYNITNQRFRNDYAFAIANNILNGYNLNESASIPWTMLSVYHEIESIDRVGSLLKINHTLGSDGRYPTTTVLAPQNLHILDKDYLLTDSFKQFIETCCE